MVDLKTIKSWESSFIKRVVNLNKGSKSCYIIIFNSALENKSCNGDSCAISLGNIARKMGCSIAWIRVCLVHLTRQKLISISHNRSFKRVNIYTILKHKWMVG
jgi:hypothetical protein